MAIALIAGLIGSQGPEFAHQYRQRIGGALDELRRIVAEFDAEAASEGLTPSEGVRRLEADSDPLARRREGFLVPVPSDADAPGTSHVEMVVATTLSFPCQGRMIRRWPASVPRALWIIALSMPAVGTIAARGRRYRKATLVRDYLFL